MSGKIVTEGPFYRAMQAVWGEIEHQNALSRITYDGEAKDVPGFLTLGRRYMARAEAAWADGKGDDAALHELRKLAAIFVRAMVYCGTRSREEKGKRR